MQASELTSTHESAEVIGVVPQLTVSFQTLLHWVVMIAAARIGSSGGYVWEATSTSSTSTHLPWMKFTVFKTIELLSVSDYGLMGYETILPMLQSSLTEFDVCSPWTI